MKNKKALWSIIVLAVIVLVILAAPLVSGLVAKKLIFHLADQINTTYHAEVIKINKYQLGYLESNALLTVNIPDTSPITVPAHINNGPFTQYKNKFMFGVVAQSTFPIKALQIEPQVSVSIPFLNKSFAATVFTDKIQVITALQKISAANTELNIQAKFHEHQIQQAYIEFTANAAKVENKQSGDLLTIADANLALKLNQLGAKGINLSPSMVVNNLEVTSKSNDAKLNIKHLSSKGLRVNSLDALNIFNQIQTQKSYDELIPQIMQTFLSDNNLEIKGIDLRDGESDTLKVKTFNVTNKVADGGFHVSSDIDQVELKSLTHNINLNLGKFGINVTGKKLPNATWNYIPTIILNNFQLEAAKKIKLDFDELHFGPYRFNSTLTKQLYKQQKDPCEKEESTQLFSQCKIQYHLENLQHSLMYQTYAVLPNTKFDLNKLHAESEYGQLNANIQQSYENLPANPTIIDVIFARKQHFSINSPQMSFPIHQDTMLTSKDLSLVADVEHMNGQSVIKIANLEQTGSQPFHVSDMMINMHYKSQADYTNVYSKLILTLGNFTAKSEEIANNLKSALELKHIDLKEVNDLLIKLNLVAKPKKSMLTPEQKSAAILSTAKVFLRHNPQIKLTLNGNLLTHPLTLSSVVVWPIAQAEKADNLQTFFLALTHTQVHVAASVSPELLIYAMNNVNSAGTYAYPKPMLPPNEYLEKIIKQGVVKQAGDKVNTDFTVGINHIEVSDGEMSPLQKGELYMQLGLYQHAYNQLNKAFINNQEDPETTYYLGVLKYHGLGTKRDQEAGDQLMSKAASLGYEPAKEYLKTKGQSKM